MGKPARIGEGAMAAAVPLSPHRQEERGEVTGCGEPLAAQPQPEEQIYVQVFA